MFVFVKVGLMMRGLVIESTIMGGPAYASQRLGPGDVVLRVDDQIATEVNVALLLVGNDKPGSKVVVTVAKGGDKVLCLWRLSINFFI